MTLPRFIADQQIRLLKVPPGRAHRIMEYVMALGTDPMRRDGAPFNERDHDRLWPVQDRLTLLGDLSIKRLCITVDAGVGKSIALRQLQYVTQQQHPEHLVLCIELRDLPVDVNGMLDEYRTIHGQSCPPLMVSLFRNEVQLNYGHGEPNEVRQAVVQGWLRSMANRGNLTLCVDGVDQSSDALREASVLKQFMTKYPHVRIVIAGRPYAISRVKDSLGFSEVATGPSGPQPVWQFAKVERFTVDQVEEYLGSERYQQTRQLEADQQFLPRTLNIVRTLDWDEMAQMRTASDLYWYSTYVSLRESLQKVPAGSPLANWDALRVLRVISSVAFGLWCWNATPELQVDDSEVSRLLHFMNTKINIPDRIRQFDEDFESLIKALVELGQMNTEVVKLNLYYNSQSIESIQFGDATIRDFLAAYWATNYACSPDGQTNASEQKLLRERVAKVAYQKDAIFGADFESFWKLCAAIPVSLEFALPPASDDHAYAATISVLFERPASHSRPTELMYLAWPGLLARVGFLSPPRIDEAKLHAATKMAQYWVREGAKEDHMGTRAVVFDFLSEYLKFRDLGDPELIKFEQGFRKIPAGKFLYGANAVEKEIPAQFEICAYQVWNSLYDRFDKHHERGRRLYERGAVTNKSWHDAMMFATWSHGCLPTELQWEAACRGRVGDLEISHHTVFCFGNDVARLEEYAWYDRNSSVIEVESWFCAFLGIEKKSRAGIYKHVHTVGQKKANSYGLYDVHGNVWEWMREGKRAWEGEGKRPLLRGGSFYDFADCAGCATQYNYEPDSVSETYGLRVARSEY